MITSDREHSHLELIELVGGARDLGTGQRLRARADAVHQAWMADVLCAEMQADLRESVVPLTLAGGGVGDFHLDLSTLSDLVLANVSGLMPSVESALHEFANTLDRAGIEATGFPA